MDEQILAIVGIGEAGMPIIRKAKEMQVKTVGFGMADSLGKGLVDVFEEVSIFDINGMYEACKRNHVTGVIGPSEISTEPAAILADRLGLPGNSVKDGFFARNKYLMRQKASSLTSIRQPHFHLYKDGEANVFPAVVKAVDSCGKQGISLARNEEELATAVAEARAVSSDGTALIEEYLAEGQEYSVECLASGEAVTVVQVTEKDSSGPPHFAEAGHHQPANIAVELRERIEIAAKDILNVLGITCGMAHLEIKVSNQEIYFIEVGARGGGGHIADTLTPLSTDCDYYGEAIKCSLGTYEPHEIHTTAYSGLYFHIQHNRGLDELFKLADHADWVYENTVATGDYPDAVYFLDRMKAGYIIYHADHRIDMHEVVKNKNLHVTRINDHPHAFEILLAHNKEIGREMSDEELKAGIEKFLKNGEVLTILDGEHVIGFLNLYCNNFETLSAYICNVYVLNNYRGCGLSRKLMDEAISICRQKKFKKISLHVAADNTPAVSLYRSYGFEFTGNQNAGGSPEMAIMLD